MEFSPLISTLHDSIIIDYFVLFYTESILKESFSVIELQSAIDELKTRKTSGLNSIYEQIKHLGPRSIAKKWLLDLFNDIMNTQQILKIWRKSKIITLLKPGKTSDDPKNFRSISLLCHTYKLYERLIIHRLNTYIDNRLIREQASDQGDLVLDKYWA